MHIVKIKVISMMYSNKARRAFNFETAHKGIPCMEVVSMKIISVQVNFSLSKFHVTQAM